MFFGDEEMSKSIEYQLKDCLNTNTEEEVKNIFSRVFDFELNTQDQIDALTEFCLFEFKYDLNFKSLDNRSKVFAQALHYVHRLFKDQIVPDYICIANKESAMLVATDNFKGIYENDLVKFEDVWKNKPSEPSQTLIDEVSKIEIVNNGQLYLYSNKANVIEFSDDLKKVLRGKGKTLKQKITERNIEKVWTIWTNHFEEYVKNKDYKPTFYFYCDIQEGKTYVVEKTEKNSRICFVLDENSGESSVILLPTSEYEDFWKRFKKLTDYDTINKIQQKIYQLENTDVKKFQGMFYTPRPEAKRALEYLENYLGENFWANGEYRIWDMCAGTGNLEYDFDSSLIEYCYLSTLEPDEVKYCEALFPNAKAVFQYDYLNDDVTSLLGNTIFDSMTQLKMPNSLKDDLNNPNIKWIVFINPPYAEASESKKAGEKRKSGVNDTQIAALMKKGIYGNEAHELYTQFLYRIMKEMPLNRTTLCMFSTPKYIIASSNRKMRDNLFLAKYRGGFVINSHSFSQCKGSPFPIIYAMWDLSNKMKLNEQNLVFDVYGTNPMHLTEKHFVEPNKTINEWFEREKNTRTFVPFSSAIQEKAITTSDIRDRVTDSFLGYLGCSGTDVQNNKYTCLMSAPTGTHMGTCITETNFIKCIIINAVRNIVTLNWLNNRDQYSVPNSEVDIEFKIDCLIWSLFDGSNQSASIRNVYYKDKTYQVTNNFYPFTKEEMKINSRFPNSFVSNLIASNRLSDEASKVLNIGKKIYETFYKRIDDVDLTKWRIDKIDYRCGWYQIRNALLELNDKKINQLIDELKANLDLLKLKIEPQIYCYGFLTK